MTSEPTRRRDRRLGGQECRWPERPLGYVVATRPRSRWTCSRLDQLGAWQGSRCGPAEIGQHDVFQADLVDFPLGTDVASIGADEKGGQALRVTEADDSRVALDLNRRSRADQEAVLVNEN